MNRCVIYSYCGVFQLEWNLQIGKQFLNYNLVKRKQIACPCKIRRDTVYPTQFSDGTWTFLIIQYIIWHIVQNVTEFSKHQ